MTCSSEQTSIKAGAIFNTGYGSLRIIRFLGKGKSGYSWLAESSEENVVLKLMHDEEVPYYQFNGSKLNAELTSYEKLLSSGIRMPELLFHDVKNSLLIKEYIEGKTGSEVIAAGNADSVILGKLCKMYIKVKNAGLNIDYFPSNFVIGNGELCYIDYECNPYDFEWGLENWGLYYWVNEDGMKKFIINGDASAINLYGTGKPVKTGLDKKVNEVIIKFLN